jgi:hypothetical protein
MAFDYINPGYGSMLDGGVGTYYTESTNPTFSNTGISFNNNSITTIMVSPSSMEIYAKIDFYLSASNTGKAFFEIRSANMQYVYFNDWNAYIAFVKGDLSGTSTSSIGNTNSSTMPNFHNKLHTLYTHAISNETSGFLEVYIDNTKVFTYTGELFLGGPISNIGFHTNGSPYFSNIIISTSEINKNTTIIPVTTDISGDWKNNNGVYTTSIVGTQLYGKVNKTNLLTKIDNKDGIDGVLLVQKPIFVSADNSTLDSIVATAKNDTTETELETTRLSTDTSSILYKVFPTNPITNSSWNTSDFDIIQFGVKSNKIPVVEGAWVQPVLTSNTSYGTITTTTDNSSLSSFPAYNILDGSTSTWWQLGKKGGINGTYQYAGFINWALPETISITGISILNRSTARPNLTLQIYADTAKTIKIGDALSFTTLGQTLAVQNIPTTGIKTNDIYFDCSSTEPWLGITEVTITANTVN